MPSDVEVENAPPIVADDEEPIEHAMRRRDVDWKRTEEKPIWAKFFTIMVATEPTRGPVARADWERTGRATGDSANCFEMWWPGTELNRRRQFLFSLAYKYF